MIFLAVCGKLSTKNKRRTSLRLCFTQVGAQLLVQTDKVFQTLGKTSTNRLEHPLAAVALVQRAELNGGNGGEIIFQTVLGELFTGFVVVNGNVAVGHLTEVLAAGGGVVNGHDKRHFLRGGVDLVQIHNNAFIVAITRTGAVVAGVGHATFRVGLVVVKHEMAVGDQLGLTAGIVLAHKHRGVQIELTTGVVTVGVPAQAHTHAVEARIGLGKIDVAALGQIDTHDVVLFLRERESLFQRGHHTTVDGL